MDGGAMIDLCRHCHNSLDGLDEHALCEALAEDPRFVFLANGEVAIAPPLPPPGCLEPCDAGNPCERCRAALEARP
jgi:hypothetical protein